MRRLCASSSKRRQSMRLPETAAAGGESLRFAHDALVFKRPETIGRCAGAFTPADRMAPSADRCANAPGLDQRSCAYIKEY
jgi:hypothetical protein